MSSPIPASHWDELYQQAAVEEMPWFYAKLDGDIEGILGKLKIARGAVLDIGSGPGTQAIELARRGFETTALDISPAAVENARARARDEGVKVRFLHGDILKTRLIGKFDLIVDRGCFHILAPERREKYVKTVTRLLKKRGYLLLKTFSHKEPPGPGPYRLRPDEVEKSFSGHLDILSIRDTMFHGNHRKAPRALFCVMRKS
jgi:cyclopropane fatty-acyl-phospholipid synthase-like methyltransferase